MTNKRCVADRIYAPSCLTFQFGNPRLGSWLYVYIYKINPVTQTISILVFCRSNTTYSMLPIFLCPGTN